MATLDNQTLLDTFKQSSATWSGPEIVSYLESFGYKNVAQITTQLQSAGLTKAQATALVTAKGPSDLQIALQGIAGGLFFPGSSVLGAGDAAAGDAADTTAADEAAGKGKGSPTTPVIPNALQNLLKNGGSSLIWLPVIEWITTSKNWVRVLEFVGGAVMIGIAMRELANT